jgi:hypothetical protein
VSQEPRDQLVQIGAFAAERTRVDETGKLRNIVGSTDE